jgi:D-proline reductase (dithiol) PrdB
VGALSYFLEREGIMTTGISLVRENTASMQPPRALWVPFPLGRPLGVPGDAAFQHRVISAALDLFNRTSGPVLEDYPEDAPAVEVENAPACPVSFQKPASTSDNWSIRLTHEVNELAPWYELGLRRRQNRTLVGVSDLTPADIARQLGEWLDAGERPRDIPLLKRAIEDLKAFYLEAITAQPGEYNFEASQRQFWHETVAGTALLSFYHLFQHADDDRMKLVAGMIAPRAAVEAVRESNQ